MALKKSDLFSSIWASCDELRSGMDASVSEGRYAQDHYIQLRPKEVLLTKDGTIAKVGEVMPINAPT